LKRFAPQLVLVSSIVTILMLGCGKKAQVRAPSVASIPGTVQVGTASWYGRPYHGRQAASGEIYDMEKMTAAHRTLPFGTRVRVQNLENGKIVDLRIIDRGPFVKDRIIDVSHAAAQALAMVGSGTAKVRVEVVSIPTNEPTPLFAVQVGAFQDRARAERLQQKMEERYGTAKLVEREGNPVMWRVLVGKSVNIEAAQSLAHRIRSENPDMAGAAFVVRLD
jgi:rare lipoprotein A